MVEVFATNVKSEVHSKEILQVLKINYPALRVNFDLEDFNEAYPRGHSILRIEGDLIDTASISQELKHKGIECELLEDKISS